MSGKICSLTAAVALATATAAGAGAASASSLNLVQFRSPSGNIGCILDSQEARCDIAHFTYKPPVHRCTGPFGGDFGNSFFITRRGKGVMGCVTDSALDPNGHALAYGKSITFGRFTCSSATTGMTCRNTRTGHGFFLSIQSYRLF